MILSLINNLNQDISLLQHRIERDKDVGFNHMSRLLESMAIQFFKALDIANLKSKNQIKVNFPAIDSADEDMDGGVALQVTSVADTKKIKDTIAKFEKKDATGKSLKDDYAILYIFGFCKASCKTIVPAYCKVIDTSFLVNKLIDINDEDKVQIIIDAVRQHVDYSSIHPYSDIECLKIALGYIGRNAVRHYMSSEGNIDDMTKGLNEISELIGKGTVNGREKSKAQHEFDDQVICTFLIKVLNEIGSIKAIINHANRNGFVCLNLQDMQAIDNRKREITKMAEDIAGIYNVNMPLHMYEIN